MKRTFKKKLITYIQQYANQYNSVSNHIVEHILHYLEEEGCLSSCAYEPTPFECWVCPVCYHSCPSKTCTQHLRNGADACTGTPILMTQKEHKE